MYNKASGRIHIDNEEPRKIHIKRGVRQGDPINPKLFATALEDVMKKADIQGNGIQIDGELLSDLRFADDICLVTDLVIKMEDQLKKINAESKKVGLKPNL